MPAVIDRFEGRYAFLSNFHPRQVHWEGITYPSTEHAFNAGKSIDMGVRLWVAKAPTPTEAKRRGRSVQLRPHWDERVRFEVMEEVLRVKFSDPELAAALVATGDAELREGTRWHDLTWGAFCSCGRKACDRPGENHLGRLLMKIRSELRTRPALFAAPTPTVVVHAAGDLLAADAEALVNPVNCVGVMGAGLALQFKQAHPAMFEAYRVACQVGQVRPGRVFVHREAMPAGTRYIINFPTKRHFREPSRIEDIDAGLGDLARVVRELGIRSIAIPALGCGLGGLRWAEVRSMIEYAFAGVPDVRVLLYGPR